MKDLISKAMTKALAVGTVALRIAAVGLFYGGIHWLAWRYLGPRLGWMVDAWLVSGVVLGIALVAVHRLMPRHAETVDQIIFLFVGGIGLSSIPGEIARLMPHAALLRWVDFVCDVLAVLVVAAGLLGMFLELRALRGGNGRKT